MKYLHKSVDSEDLIFNLWHTMFASTPQTPTSNVGEKTVVYDLFITRLPTMHSFLVDRLARTITSKQHLNILYLFFTLPTCNCSPWSASICIWESINRIQNKGNWTILQVGNKILISEIEKQCKHATDKWKVKCMISARTNFFSKRRNVSQQQNIIIGKFVAVGKIK
jgi:hypothetical protein